MDLCAPDPGDDECAACTKMDCCDELKECYMDEPCKCFIECSMSMSPFVCINMCPGFDIGAPIVGCAMGCGCGA
jgi:hypothetical protein